MTQIPFLLIRHITYRFDIPSKVGSPAGRKGRELQHRLLCRRSLVGGLKVENHPLHAVQGIANFLQQKFN